MKIVETGKEGAEFKPDETSAASGSKKPSPPQKKNAPGRPRVRIETQERTPPTIAAQMPLHPSTTPDVHTGTGETPADDFRESSDASEDSPSLVLTSKASESLKAGVDRLEELEKIREIERINALDDFDLERANNIAWHLEQERALFGISPLTSANKQTQSKRRPPRPRPTPVTSTVALRRLGRLETSHQSDTLATSTTPSCQQGSPTPTSPDGTSQAGKALQPLQALEVSTEALPTVVIEDAGVCFEYFQRLRS